MFQNQIFRTSFVAGTLLAIGLGLGLARLWSAENQVRLHSEHLLARIEKRDWSAVAEMVAPNYRDDWGDDRGLLVSRLRATLRVFPSLTITTSSPRLEVGSSSGKWSARIEIAGNGPEFAPEIIARVNSLTTPFELHWQKQSWHPWDWKLVAVRNPSLELPDDGF
jgi:hypothetical protein